MAHAGVVVEQSGDPRAVMELGNLHDRGGAGLEALQHDDGLEQPLVPMVKNLLQTIQADLDVHPSSISRTRAITAASPGPVDSDRPRALPLVIQKTQHEIPKRRTLIDVVLDVVLPRLCHTAPPSKNCSWRARATPFPRFYIGATQAIRPGNYVHNSTSLPFCQ